jgi:hypothetical protein
VARLALRHRGTVVEVDSYQVEALSDGSEERMFAHRQAPPLHAISPDSALRIGAVTLPQLCSRDSVLAWSLRGITASTAGHLRDTDLTSMNTEGTCFRLIFSKITCSSYPFCIV